MVAFNCEQNRGLVYVYAYAKELLFVVGLWSGRVMVCPSSRVSSVSLLFCACPPLLLFSGVGVDGSIRHP